MTLHAIESLLDDEKTFSICIYNVNLALLEREKTSAMSSHKFLLHLVTLEWLPLLNESILLKEYVIICFEDDEM